MSAASNEERDLASSSTLNVKVDDETLIENQAENEVSTNYYRPFLKYYFGLNDLFTIHPFVLYLRMPLITKTHTHTDRMGYEKGI